MLRLPSHGLGLSYFKELDREFGLAKHGLTWLWPEIDLVHPLDDGTAGVLWRDINRTAEGLGADGKRWLDVFGYLAENFDELVQDVFQPIVHVPKHPLMLARFGTGALLPATGFARMFKTPQARALFGGVAAHMFGTLTLPLSSAVGSMLTAAAHAHGWPVAQGGSGSIAAALASILRSLGGTIETGNWVTNYSQIADYDIVMLDIAPDAAGRLLDGGSPTASPGRTANSATAPPPTRSTTPCVAIPTEASCRGRICTPARPHPASVREDFGNCGCRTPDRSGSDAGQALHSVGPAVLGRPFPVRRRHPPGLGVCACAARLSG
ncbi:hypothetical protein GCM10020255_040440 [Rhodococcus baikonurensis]